MPIQEMKFRPGINRELTNYANKSGFYDGNKIRFRTGSPEKIGGWANAYPGNTFNGVARTLWTWETSTGQIFIAMGTNQKYYVNLGGTFYDITPTTSGTLTNPFSTTSGSPLITVTDPTAVTLGTWVTFTGESTTATSGTGTTATVTFTPALSVAPAVGSTVTISGVTPTGYNGTYTVTASSTTTVSFASTTTGAQTVAGHIAFSVGGVIVNGSYEVISIVTGGYTILAASNATSTVSSKGGALTVTYELNAGNAIVSPAIGWGSPPWGSGGWGAITSVNAPLRLWSQGNFGDDLIFAQLNGAMYFWNYVAGGFNSAVSINTAAEQNVKTTQTVVYAVTTGNTFVVANAQGVDYGALVTGSGVSAGTYVAVSPTYAGYTTIVVTNANYANPLNLSPGQSVSFSYSGQTAPTEVGTVLVSTTNQFVVALGSTPYNPATFSQTYDPLLVRWSDQSIPYEWTPSTANQSGEQALSLGSYIVAGLNTRTEILIWTDRALFSMQYVGAPFVFSFTLMLDNISIISPNAAITVNGATYWMGTDKFYTYNGTVTPLPCTVRKFVFSNINTSQTYQIVCGQNEQFNEIWWLYPSANGNNGSASPVNDSYVIYNYLENLWYYGTINRTAWYQSSLFSWPLAVSSVQTSYLNATISATDTSFTLINGTSYPPSGKVLIGNEYISYSSHSSNTFTVATNGRGAAGFNGLSTTPASHSIYSQVSYVVPNQILYHEYGIDDLSQSTTPQAINSYLQTSDVDIDGGDRFGYVWRFLPDFTFQGSTAATPQIYLTLEPRNSSGSAYMTGGDISNVADSTVTNTQAAPLPPNTTPVEQFTGTIYTRIRGRQMYFYISSPNVGVTWQMGTNRFDFRSDGRR